MNLEQITKFCIWHFGLTGWIAVDKDLKVYWHDTKPYMDNEYYDWGTYEGVCELVCTKYTGDKDWRDTLTSLATIELLCNSCNNHHHTTSTSTGWYCSVELTNPSNMCIGYKMRGRLDEHTM